MTTAPCRRGGRYYRLSALRTEPPGFLAAGRGPKRIRCRSSRNTAVGGGDRRRCGVRGAHRNEVNLLWKGKAPPGDAVSREENGSLLTNQPADRRRRRCASRKRPLGIDRLPRPCRLPASVECSTNPGDEVIRQRVAAFDDTISINAFASSIDFAALIAARAPPTAPPITALFAADAGGAGAATVSESASAALGAAASFRNCASGVPPAFRWCPRSWLSNPTARWQR